MHHKPEIVDRGMPVPRVQQLLGHKDIRTTMIYTHLTNKDINSLGTPLDKILKKVNKDMK